MNLRWSLRGIRGGQQWHIQIEIRSKNVEQKMIQSVIVNISAEVGTDNSEIRNNVA